MLKALVFDFDGVIVDTETAWYDIYKDWLKQCYNYTLEKKDYLMCVGADTTKLITFLQEVVDPDIDIVSFEKNAIKEFIHRTKNLPAKAGVLALLKEAKRHDLKVALATSATRKKPETHLQRLGLIQYFDALATAELVKQIKPSPDLFLMAAQLVGVTPQECLAIEDSQNGVLSASRAKMHCLIVPNEITSCGTFSSCYQMVTSLEEVKLDEIIKDFENT